jgi:hypothetical protein
MRRSKKSKPSFDLARTQLSEDRVGWVYRSDALEAGVTKSSVSASPEASIVAEPAPQESRSWVEMGIGVMVLPLSLTLIAMVAPVYWLLASRERQ